MKKIVLLLSITLLFSCKAKTDYEIKDVNGKGIIIKSSGDIIINNETIGKISDDGTFMDSEGVIMAKLGANNTLLDYNGKPLVRIGENGKLDNGSGVFIEWSKNGELLKVGEKTGTKITPVDKDFFRNASIVIFMYLIFDSSSI